MTAYPFEVVQGEFLPEVEVQPLSDGVPHVKVRTSHLHTPVRPLVFLNIIQKLIRPVSNA